MNPQEYFNDNSANLSNLFSSYDEDYLSVKETFYESSNEKDSFEEKQENIFTLCGQEQLRNSYSTQNEEEEYYQDYTSSANNNQEQYAKQQFNLISNNSQADQKNTLEQFYGFNQQQEKQQLQVKSQKLDLEIPDFDFSLPKIEPSAAATNFTALNTQTTPNPINADCNVITQQRQIFEEQLNFLRDYRRKQQELEIQTLKLKFEQQMQTQQQQNQSSCYNIPQQASTNQPIQTTAILEHSLPYIKQEKTENEWVFNSNDESFNLSSSNPNSRAIGKQSKKIKKPKLNYKNQIASSETKNLPATIGNILINKLREKLPDNQLIQNVGKVKTIQDLKDLFSLSNEIKMLCLYFLQSGPMLSYISSSTRIKQKRLIVKYIDVIIEGCIDTENFGCLKKYAD